MSCDIKRPRSEALRAIFDAVVAVVAEEGYHNNGIDDDDDDEVDDGGEYLAIREDLTPFGESGLCRDCGSNGCGYNYTALLVDGWNTTVVQSYENVFHAQIYGARCVIGRVVHIYEFCDYWTKMFKYARRLMLRRYPIKPACALTIFTHSLRRMFTAILSG